MKKGRIIGGVITSAIAGCAIYFLTSKKTQKYRDELFVRVNEMKADIIKKLGDMKEITQEEYNKIVDEVSKKYKRLSKVSEREFSNIIEDLKQAWKHIKKAAK
ncbi:MAG: hypothetical protein K6357_04120 [Elusimicrobiota bacterium]